MTDDLDIGLWESIFPSEGVLSPYAAATEPRDPQRIFRYWLMPQNPAGVRVTPENALQVSVVWACVDVISKSIAASEWNVFERLKSGNRRLLTDDPLYYLLNVRPNDDMTAIAFREALGIMALTWGNGYAEISRDLSGRAASLYPITPDKCEPRRAPDDGRLIYHVWNDDGSEVDLEKEDVFHLRGPSINGLMGDNMIAKAALSIGLTMALERYSATYFGNNTQIGGVLEVPGNLDDKAYSRLVESFEARHRGPNKAHRPFIAEGGAKFNQTTSNAEESQLVLSRQNQVEEICRWYGVPPHKVAHLLRSTNNNIEQQGIEFTRDALKPWCIRNQQESDFKLLSARGKPRFTRIDIEWLSQGDAQARANYYQTMRNIGAYSVNDILKLEGRDTIGPDGDIRLVNSANIRLGEVGANWQKVDPDDDQDDQGNQKEPASTDSGDTLNRALVTCFAQVYGRFSTRLKHRMADFERAERTSDEREDFMRKFRMEQTRLLHEELVKPCQLLTQIARCETFGAALERGQRVAFDGADSERSAAELVEQFTRKS